MSLTPDTFNRIQNLYSQLLVAANQASSTVNCSIAIGRITGVMNSNCVVNIKNVCRNQNDSLTLLDTAVSTVLSILNNQQTTQLFTLYNQLRQECVAQSTILQSINVQDIDLGICKPRFRTEFNFTNSGEAISNCLVSSMIRTTQQEIVEVENDLLSSIRDNFYLIPIGLCIAGLAVIGLLILGRERVTIVWRKT